MLEYYVRKCLESENILLGYENILLGYANILLEYENIFCEFITFEAILSKIFTNTEICPVKIVRYP